MGSGARGRGSGARGRVTHLFRHVELFNHEVFKTICFSGLRWWLEIGRRILGAFLARMRPPDGGAGDASVSGYVELSIMRF